MITIPKQGCSNPVLLPWTNSSEKLILKGNFSKHKKNLLLCHKLFLHLYKQVNSVSLQLFTWYRSPHVHYIIYIKLNLTRLWHAVSFTSTSNTGVHVHPAMVACWIHQVWIPVNLRLATVCVSRVPWLWSSLWIKFSSWPYCCGSAWSLPFVRGREYR